MPSRVSKITEMGLNPVFHHISANSYPKIGSPGVGMGVSEKLLFVYHFSLAVTPPLPPPPPPLGQ